MSHAIPLLRAPERRAPLRRRRVLAIAVGWTVALAGCVAPRTALHESAWRETKLGLCEDYPEETRTVAAARDDLRLARENGATVLRVAFGWDAMEPERGRYDWTFWDGFVADAAKSGVQLIPYVCYTPRWAASDQGDDFWRSPPRDAADFGRFMRTIVSRYRASIRTWELWNEPDNPAYWSGSAAQLADLVRAGAAGVRAADPSARVVLGGIATELGFLEELFRDHRLAPAVDVVNLHAYFETWHPDAIETLPEYVARAAEITAEHGEAEPLWLAETGYSSVGGRAEISAVYRAAFQGEHEEMAQADALARTVFLALGTERLPVIAWYRINDLAPRTAVIGDDNNLHLGLRRADGRPKPALRAFAELARTFSDGYRGADLPVRVEHAGPGAVPVVRAFALRNGTWLIAAWLRAPGSAAGSAPPLHDERRAAIRVTLPADFRPRHLRREGAEGALATGDEVQWREGAREAVFQLRGGRVCWGVWTP